MANVRVKDLPNANTLADADELIIDSSSAGTRRISYSELKSEVAGDYVAAPSTYKVATLASDNKLDPSQVPDTLSQGLNFVGNANSAGDLTSTTQGDFYVIQTAFGVYSVGDQAVYDGSAYVRVTDGTKQIAEGGTGATTLSDAQINLEIGNIGTRPQDIPLNSFLNSGAWVDWDSHYQTGTWDGVYAPATGTFASITMDADLGYVKNGKLVTVSGQIKTDALDTTGGSGQLKIDGLPFAASKVSAITIGFAWNFGSSFPLSGYISGSSIYLTTRTSTTARTDNYDVTGMTTGTSADRNNLYFSGTYQIA